MSRRCTVPAAALRSTCATPRRSAGTPERSRRIAFIRIDVQIDRYHRQQLLPQIGERGQKILTQSRVLLIGCGALGSVIADQLARAGIGFLRIVDRDLVDWTNLQRQVLYDESDARDATPKAIAAAKRLSAINSSIQVDA